MNDLAPGLDDGSATAAQDGRRDGSPDRDRSGIGVVLAAGEGRRMGRPKALIRDAWGVGLLARAVAALRDGGCDDIVVVLGARAGEVDVPPGDDVHVCLVDDWADGMSASLRAGLRACDEIARVRVGAAAAYAVVTLVDLPDVDAATVRRVREAAIGAGPAQARDALVRACYDERPGHPVVLGRAWWERARESAVGDAGARALFAAHAHVLVECDDLASGRDVDTPDDLASSNRLSASPACLDSASHSVTSSAVAQPTRPAIAVEAPDA